MAITTRDGLIAAIAASQRVVFYKSASTVTFAAFFTLFRVAGNPGAGGIPGTAAGQTLDRTSVGAMAIPAASATSYLTSFQAVVSNAETLLIADRLVETGTLSGIVTTAQTVNSITLPARATGALDVELWLEVYTALGATASPTVTASYTNQAGTAGRTATLVGGLPGTTGGIANRSYQMSLQAGDTGVQSVQTVTSTTSTGTAGAFGVVLRRSLIMAPLAAAGIGFIQGYAETDMQILADAACVEILVMSTNTSTGVVMGSLGVSQG